MDEQGSELDHAMSLGEDEVGAESSAVKARERLTREVEWIKQQYSVPESMREVFDQACDEICSEQAEHLWVGEWGEYQMPNLDMKLREWRRGMGLPVCEITADVVAARYQTDLARRYLLCRVLGADKDMALGVTLRTREESKSQDKFFMVNQEGVEYPARGIKSHIVINMSNRQFLRVLEAVRDVCGNEVAWKAYLPNETDAFVDIGRLNDNMEQKEITIYAPADNPGDDGENNPRTNFRNTFILDRRLSEEFDKRKLYARGVTQVIDTDLRVVRKGAQGGDKQHVLIGVRLGVLSASKTREISSRLTKGLPEDEAKARKDQFPDGWKDNREKRWVMGFGENLPPGVTVDEIRREAAKEGLLLDPERLGWELPQD